MSAAPSQARPRFSVSEWSLPTTTVFDDIDLCAAHEVRGLQVSEKKFAGEFRRVRRYLEEMAVQVSGAIPDTLSILPAENEFGGRVDPVDRIDDLCASVGRLARLRPESLLIVTGAPGELAPSEAHRIVVGGLRRICDAAAEHGIEIAVEPMRQDFPVKTSLITTIPETLALMADVDRRNLKICFDIWHLWDTPDIQVLAERHAPSVASVHLCDRPATVRASKDRMLPGDGVLDLAAIMAALERGGYRGWYHLFVASLPEFPDSPWRLPPAEFITRGAAGFAALATAAGMSG